MARLSVVVNLRCVWYSQTYAWVHQQLHRHISTPVMLVLLVEIGIYLILHLAWALSTISILGPHGSINSCYQPAQLGYIWFCACFCMFAAVAVFLDTTQSY